MLAEARELAWIEVGASTDTVALSTTLLTTTLTNHTEFSIPINTLAATFCTVISNGTYDDTNKTIVTAQNTTHETLITNLIDAKKSVDLAIIYAKRVQGLTYKEIGAAKLALENTINEKQRIIDEEARRVEEQRLKPIKCPLYTYVKTPETLITNTLNATLLAVNRHALNSKLISGDAGLSVEQCAEMVFAQADSFCSNKFHMKYSEQFGCYCYDGADDAVFTTSASEGMHFFRITKIDPEPLLQTARIVKEQSYCKNFKNVGSFPTIDECFAAIQPDAECANSENTFTWDPMNNGWCSCCTLGAKNALTKNINTRDKESVIYKQDNDRTDTGVTVWNGQGYTGDKKVFEEGWYDIAQLGVIGNDRMTGLDVPEKFKATVYQHHKGQGKK